MVIIVHWFVRQQKDICYLQKEYAELSYLYKAIQVLYNSSF
jgi:hypothetical protein